MPMPPLSLVRTAPPLFPPHFFPEDQHNTHLTTTLHGTRRHRNLNPHSPLSFDDYTPLYHILCYFVLPHLNHPGTPIQITHVNNTQTPTTPHCTQFTPHPPIIHLPQHNRTTNQTHPLLFNTELKLTSHNTAKNLENIEAIILSRFHKEADILCLQDLPNTPQLDPSLNLTMYCDMAPDHTNGVAIILPNYLSTFSKLIKHPNIRGTLLPLKSRSSVSPLFTSSMFTSPTSSLPTND